MGSLSGERYAHVMDGSPIGDYLRARREQVRPEDVGVVWSGVRRVPGLRREEVAALAGISPEYYLRLEQGRDRQPSAQVLRALGRALQLNEASVTHLYRLAHPEAHTPPVREADVVDPTLLDMMSQWRATPALLTNSCRDILAVNPIMAALDSAFLRVGHNMVEDLFTPGAKALTPGWDELAAGSLASLRLSARSDDPRLIELVGQMSIRDPDFRRLWARADVLPISSGPSMTAVEGFGLVQIRWHNLEVSNSGGQTIVAFFGESGTNGERALQAVADSLVPSTR